MSYSFEYIDIILLAMIAGFIFLRLRGILGKRTGHKESVDSSFPHDFLTEKKSVVKAGMSGGSYKPLNENDLEKIHQAALEILSSVGIADATPEVIDLSLKSGCLINDHGRLCFPNSFHGLKEPLPVNLIPIDYQFWAD